MRTNKVTENVFLDILSDDNKVGSYVKFIGDANLQDSHTLKYISLVNANLDVLQELADLEEIILQKKAIENINEIKIVISGDYIYVRCPFFRRDKVAKEIRVIVDKISTWSTKKQFTINDGYKNTKFMDFAKIKLAKAMGDVLQLNVNNYNSKYSNKNKTIFKLKQE